MTDESTAGGLQPRKRCPWCGGPVEQTSVNPLEENGTAFACGYYRALGVGGGVIEDAC